MGSRSCATGKGIGETGVSPRRRHGNRWVLGSEPVRERVGMGSRRTLPMEESIDDPGLRRDGSSRSEPHGERRSNPVS